MAHTTLDRIKTWEEYFTERKSTIPTGYPPIYPVDRQLNRKVSLWQGDITRLKIDAIVNAAKSSLLGGGGVDGAIHAAAGRKLYDACKLLNGTPPGTAKVTAGFNLPATYIIHAVGPRDKDAAVLKSAYESSLRLSTKQGIRSVAFPCISTGIFGFPLQKATQIAVNTVRQFLTLNKNQMDRVIFVVYGDEERRMYEKELSKHFPIESDGSTRGSSTSRGVPTPTLTSRRISISPTKSESSVLPSFSTKRRSPTKLTPSERPSPSTGRRSSTKRECPTTSTSHTRSRSPTRRITTRPEPGCRYLVRIKFSK